MKSELKPNQFEIRTVADVYALPTKLMQDQCLHEIRAVMDTARTMEEITRAVELKETGSVPARKVEWPESFIFTYVEGAGVEKLVGATHEDLMEAMESGEHLDTSKIPDGITKTMKQRTEAAIDPALKDKVMAQMRAIMMSEAKGRLVDKLVQTTRMPREQAEEIAGQIINKVMTAVDGECDCETCKGKKGKSHDGMVKVEVHEISMEQAKRFGFGEDKGGPFLPN